MRVFRAFILSVFLMHYAYKIKLTLLLAQIQRFGFLISSCYFTIPSECKPIPLTTRRFGIQGQ